MGGADLDLLRRYHDYRRLARVSVVMATVSAVVVAMLIPSLAVFVQYTQSSVDNELSHCRWSAVALWKEYETLGTLKGVAGRLKRETYFGHFREPEDNETETTEQEQRKSGSYADKAYLMHQEVFMPARSRPVPSAYGRGGYDQSTTTTTTEKPMEKSAGYSGSAEPTTMDEINAYEGGPMVPQHPTTTGYGPAAPPQHVTSGEVHPPPRKPPTSPGYTPSRVDPYSPAYTPPRMPYTATYIGTTRRTPGAYPGYGSTIETTTGQQKNPYQEATTTEQPSYPPHYPDYHTPSAQFPEYQPEATTTEPEAYPTTTETFPGAQGYEIQTSSPAPATTKQAPSGYDGAETTTRRNQESKSGAPPGLAPRRGSAMSGGPGRPYKTKIEAPSTAPSSDQCCGCSYGEPGDPGPPGDDGERVPGLAGDHGADYQPDPYAFTSFGGPCYECLEGPVGRPGRDGRKGPRGNDGIPGAPGKPSFKSNPGLAGPPGPPGPDGEPGVPGEQGAEGQIVDTPAGVPGPSGPPGPKGPPGNPGPNGAKGRRGRAGRPGEMGDQGTPGTDGARGVDGPPGETGYPGAGASAACDHCAPPRLSPGYVVAAAAVRS